MTHIFPMKDKLQSDVIEEFQQIEKHSDGTYSFLVRARVRKDRRAPAQLFPSSGRVKLRCWQVDDDAYKRLVSAYAEQKTIRSRAEDENQAKKESPQC